MAMPLSTEEFWRLAQQARLFTAEDAARLQAEFALRKPASDPSTDADCSSLASWLTTEGQITRYQAKRLLAGRPGPFLLGDYVLREAIREGRLAGLARARHVSTGYDVLLAFCDETTASSPARLALWERAARTACGTISPRLSRTYEIVALSKRRFVVVEELVGATVAERLARGEKFSPAEACRIVYEVAVTAITFEGAGRVHGEIRSDNVWLDDAGRVKLLQFPLASAASERKASPASSPASDVRALGTLLYWLLFGRSPSSDAREGRNPLARAAADLPAPYARLLAYLLTNDPAKRYQNAAMAADGLAAVAAAAPPQGDVVEPPSPARLAYEATLQPPAAVTSDELPAEDEAASLAETVAWPIEEVATEFRPASEPREVAPPPLAIEPEYPLAGMTTERRAKKQGSLMLLFALLGVVAFVSGSSVYFWQLYAASATRTPASAAPAAPPTPTTTTAAKAPRSIPVAEVTRTPAAPPGDDGGVWQSPTSSEPLDLAWIAPTSQMFIAWRPAEFLSHPEGAKTLDSLGSVWQQTRSEIEKLVGLPWSQVEEVLVGLLPDESGQVRFSLVVRTLEPVAQADLLARRGQALAREIAGYTVQEIDGYAYYLPTDEERLFVVAPIEVLSEVLAAEGSPPVLRREFEQLLAHSDRSRHLTVLFAPNFLATDGRALLADGAERLRAPLAELFAGDTAAVSASMHLTADDLFTELRVAGVSEARPDALAERWQEQARTLPAKVRQHVATLVPSAYSARVLERFPEMVTALSRYTRGGVEDRDVVLRTYLPVIAAHNLALGSQLALIEREGSGAAPAEMPVAKADLSVADRLDQQTSLSFPRNTLEQALALLAESVSAEIIILGSDLQLEGITKNQSFGLDERDQPAREILLKILRLANPDGKLVYVIRAKEDGSGEAVFVTTRAAAAKRGETLPREFDVAPAPEP